MPVCVGPVGKPSDCWSSCAAFHLFSNIADLKQLPALGIFAFRLVKQGFNPFSCLLDET